MVTAQCSTLGGHTVLTFPCREFLETSAKMIPSEKKKKDGIMAWLIDGFMSAQCLSVDKKKKCHCIHPFIRPLLGFLRSAVIQITLTSLTE